jgi:hypothetical protein
VSGWLIAACGAAYVWVAIEQALKGNPGMSITYAGYAFANIGLYMMAR